MRVAMCKARSEAAGWVQPKLEKAGAENGSKQPPVEEGQRSFGTLECRTEWRWW
jgi:hypothetical protein